MAKSARIKKSHLAGFVPWVSRLNAQVMHVYKVGPEFVNAELVNISPITMVFVGDISIVDGVYKPTYNWRAQPCSYNMAPPDS